MKYSISPIHLRIKTSLLIPKLYHQLPMPTDISMNCGLLLSLNNIKITRRNITSQLTRPTANLATDVLHYYKLQEYGKILCRKSYATTKHKTFIHKGNRPNLTAIANPQKLVFASTISSFAALHRLSFSSLAPFSRFQIKNKTFDNLSQLLQPKIQKEFLTIQLQTLNI